MLNPIVCSGNVFLIESAEIIFFLVVEVLSDLGVRTESNGQKLAQNEDNLRLTDSERNGIIEKAKPNEPSELWIDLRVVQTQAILFLKSMSERVGSDMERL